LLTVNGRTDGQTDGQPEYMMLSANCCWWRNKKRGQTRDRQELWKPWPPSVPLLQCELLSTVTSMN